MEKIRLLRVDIGVIDYIVGINFYEKFNGTKQKEEIVKLAIAQLEETFSRQNLIMQDVHFFLHFSECKLIIYNKRGSKASFILILSRRVCINLVPTTDVSCYYLVFKTLLPANVELGRKAIDQGFW